MKQYTVKSGDTLSLIAAREYGDQTLWRRIWSANQTRLRSGDPEIIFPGETIIIPVLPERESLRTVSPPIEQGMSIVLNGRVIPIVSGRIIRTMDTGADGWAASINWQPGEDTELDSRLKPYSYTPAQAYIDNELLVSGLLYSMSAARTNDGIIKDLEGFSFTADLVDSTLKPPYESNNVTLSQIATEIVSPLGINVVFDTDTGGQFSRVTAEEGETIFAYLARLASQRGVLVSSTARGELLFTQATTDSVPVATLEEDEQGALEYRARFDGRARYNVYRAVGRSPIGNKESIAKDNAVPRSRFLTFQADETTRGDIGEAAKWKRSKQLAEALTLTLPVADWYDPSGNLWRENTLVTVKSPTLHVPQGFTFIIRQVSYILENEGRRAELSIVPPQVYTREELVDPWR